jgi:hypothetical protein
MTCARCQDTRWVCEEHPEMPMGHDGCGGAGDPCPDCNAPKDGDPPALPPDFEISFDDLPGPVQRYIHELESTRDPSGELRELFRLREENAMLRRECEQLCGGLDAAIRAANLALFVINKQGVMPNSSWESGFKSDLAKATAARDGAPITQKAPAPAGAEAGQVGVDRRLEQEQK